jgi:hypothetical protein
MPAATKWRGYAHAEQPAVADIQTLIKSLRDVMKALILSSLIISSLTLSSRKSDGETFTALIYYSCWVIKLTFMRDTATKIEIIQDCANYFNLKLPSSHYSTQDPKDSWQNTAFVKKKFCSFFAMT